MAGAYVAGNQIESARKSRRTLAAPPPLKPCSPGSCCVRCGRAPGLALAEDGTVWRYVGRASADRSEVVRGVVMK